MPRNKRALDIPQQAALVRDMDRLIDLACLPNDADDHSEAGRPTSDHEAEGWRATPAGKP